MKWIAKFLQIVLLTYFYLSIFFYVFRTEVYMLVLLAIGIGEVRHIVAQSCIFTLLLLHNIIVPGQSWFFVNYCETVNAWEQSVQVSLSVLEIGARKPVLCRSTCLCR